PIFYSLGNFIYTNNTLSHIAPDAYVRMGMNPWQHTPADFFDEKRGSRFQPTPYPGGYPAEGPDPVPAEGMIAVADFRQKTLREVRLYPLDTRPGTHRSMAGRPMLAQDETARAILT